MLLPVRAGFGGRILSIMPQRSGLVFWNPDEKRPDTPLNHREKTLIMCGITGYTGFNDEALLQCMRRLVHRGPDEDGYFLTPDVGLAMRRLSVIDLENGKAAYPQ